MALDRVGYRNRGPVKWLFGWRHVRSVDIIVQDPVHDGLRPLGVSRITFVRHECPTGAPLPRAQVSSFSDMYAFGILMWELYTGQQPYRALLAHISKREDRHRALLARVVHEGLRPVFPPGVPQVGHGVGRRGGRADHRAGQERAGQRSSTGRAGRAWTCWVQRVFELGVSVAGSLAYADYIPPGPCPSPPAHSTPVCGPTPAPSHACPVCVTPAHSALPFLALPATHPATPGLLVPGCALLERGALRAALHRRGAAGAGGNVRQVRSAAAGPGPGAGAPQHHGVRGGGRRGGGWQRPGRGGVAAASGGGGGECGTGAVYGGVHGGELRATGRRAAEAQESPSNHGGTMLIQLLML